jgi:hypothetical protein
MGFRSSEADPDVWLRPARKPGGEKYYECVLCYVDEVLAISTSPHLIMKSIQERFKLKGDKYGPPTSYLGAQLSKMTTPMERNAGRNLRTNTLRNRSKPFKNS